MFNKFISIRLKFILAITFVILLFGGIAMTVSYKTVVFVQSQNAGLDAVAVKEHGRKVAALLFSVFSLLTFCIILSMIFLSGFILRPVRVIMRALETFAPGKPLPEMHIPFNDEMKLLGDKFREIMTRINAMEAESKATQLKMIETEKLASIGTLASGVAHEINNPIAGIEICAYRLQKHAKLDAKQEEYVKLIAEAADHIKTIVRSLLAYVRQPNQSNELVDLRWVVMFSLKLLRYRLQKKGLTVDEQKPKTPCLVWGIRTQLVQVVVNGIINAIDASYSGGSLGILIGEKGQDYELTISDQGTGLDPEMAGKVFDPFFTTKGRESTGLGLYVSYNIVTAHQGRISLKSKETGGARLEVLLPRAADKANATDPFYSTPLEKQEEAPLLQ